MKLRTVLAPLALVLGACTPAGTAQDYGPQIRTAHEELFAKGNIAFLRDLFSPSYVAHVNGDELRGPEAIEQFVMGVRAAFPDFRYDVVILASEGDRVAWLRTNQGTHQAEYMGVPASGRAITWHDMVVTRYEGGKIAEEWAVTDIRERLSTQ